MRVHRKPPSALALRTSIKPDKTKWVSVATIKRTPQKMRVMTPTSRSEKVSSLKRKANRRTNIKEDDLHIAVRRQAR